MARPPAFSAEEKVRIVLQQGTARPMSSVINRSGFDAPKTWLAVGGHNEHRGRVSRGASCISGVRSALCARKLSRYRLGARSCPMPPQPTTNLRGVGSC
jgi:hypothetical protein